MRDLDFDLSRSLLVKTNGAIWKNRDPGEILVSQCKVTGQKTSLGLGMETLSTEYHQVSFKYQEGVWI